MIGALKYSQIKAAKNWFHVDATGRVVGRLATEISHVLQGKHKPTFTPNKEEGDFVVVTNAERILLTGRKWDQKVYYWHTGWAGGLKQQKISQTLERYPDRILRNAVMGMLPKNRLREERIKKLKIFNGAEHEHEHEVKRSVQLPQVSFEASKWKNIEVDPAIHRGFSVKWGSKDAELQLGITENWGWKRYPTQRKLRWNPLERKAIKDYIRRKDTVVWEDSSPQEDLLTITNPANRGQLKLSELERNKKNATKEYVKQITHYPRVEIKVLNHKEVNEQHALVQKQMEEDAKREIEENKKKAVPPPPKK